MQNLYSNVVTSIIKLMKSFKIAILMKICVYKTITSYIKT